jgi:hypothetical protein
LNNEPSMQQLKPRHHFLATSNLQAQPSQSRFKKRQE